MKWDREIVEIGKLKPAGYNPRVMGDKEFEDLKQSLRDYGQAQDIVCNTDYMIIGGHHRVKAMKELGWKECSIVRPDKTLTDLECKDLNIRFNAILGSFDDLKLLEILKEMGENQYPLEFTGLGDDKIQGILDQNREIIEDEAPELMEEPTAKKGEVYKLGEHRLMCGDSTVKEDVEKLMDGDKADMVFTDPPYNVNYSGRGKNTSNKIENDDMSIDNFHSFLSEAFNCISKVTKSGGCVYVCLADGKPMIRVVFETEFNNYFTQSCTIIWVKNVASIGWQDYSGQHEPILYGWNNGEHKFYGDRKQTTIWEVSRESNYKHPTMKPIELCSKGIQNSSKKGDIVLDLFGGSGSTLIACEQTQRKCYMMELDSRYIDVIIKRWENLTGNKAEKI